MLLGCFYYGSFKGLYGDRYRHHDTVVDIDTDIDTDVDVAASINWGSFKASLWVGTGQV